jgi:hypothetical protein
MTEILHLADDGGTVLRGVAPAGAGQNRQNGAGCAYEEPPV